MKEDTGMFVHRAPFSESDNKRTTKPGKGATHDTTFFNQGVGKVGRTAQPCPVSTMRFTRENEHVGTPSPP